MADKEAGKREHDFFLANGSKILVSSYVHLRKEGIDGYISDFSAMVKKVQGVMGRAEIEILPVVPVVREGMDKVGKELVSMVREWVDWIGVVSARESVRRLSGTSGRECEQQSEERIFMWKPSFHMKMKDGKTGKLGTLRLVEGDRMETTVGVACESTEMEKLRVERRGAGEGGGDKENQV